MSLDRAVANVRGCSFRRNAGVWVGQRLAASGERWQRSDTGQQRAACSEQREPQRVAGTETAMTEGEATQRVGALER